MKKVTYTFKALFDDTHHLKTGNDEELARFHAQWIERLVNERSINAEHGESFRLTNVEVTDEPE